jgi:hypothetical protein
MTYVGACVCGTGLASAVSSGSALLVGVSDKEGRMGGYASVIAQNGQDEEWAGTDAFLSTDDDDDDDDDDGADGGDFEESNSCFQSWPVFSRYLLAMVG